MSRVHCIDCGTAVVVDPTGYCPEGHHVGSAGARIEAAIGVAVPHPDEPEPWVATVELADAAPPESDQEPRAARPPTAPRGGTPFVADPVSDNGAPSPVPHTTHPDDGAAPAAPSPPAAPPEGGVASAPSGNGAPIDTDDLLRELHSLSDLDDLGAAAAPHVPSPAVPSPARPPSPAAPDTGPSSALPDAGPAGGVQGHPAGADHRADGGDHHDGLAELRALEAAIQATSERAETAVDAAPAANEDGVIRQLPTDAPTDPGPDREQLAEVADLFGRRPRQLEEPPHQRPSQTSPPAANEPPRAAFERTPWSSAPLDDEADPATTSGTTPPPAAPSGTTPPPATSSGTTPPPAAAGSTPPPPPTATPADPPVVPGSGTGSGSGSGSAPSAPAPDGGPIDLANFTARGRRVSSRAEAKRRRRGR